MHELTVKDVPVDGFQYDAYSVNTIKAKKATDGSVAIQFGGCDGETPNCLPIIPEAQPVS